MKKYTLLLIVLAGLSSTLLAQDSPKHEIGIRLPDLRDFNVIYKNNISGNTYFRLRSSFTRLNTGSGVTNFGLGSFAGLEQRKDIAGKAEFFYGGELGLFYSYSSFTNVNSSSLNVSLGGIFGIQHKLSEYFNLGIEIVPSIGINTSTNLDANIFFDASFSSAAIFVTYKFGKTLD
jgi:hypothetical protein